MGEPTDSTTTGDAERPQFRGCVFCYTAEMIAYGVRKARR